MATVPQLIHIGLKMEILCNEKCVYKYTYLFAQLPQRQEKDTKYRSFTRADPQINMITQSKENIFNIIPCKLQV